MLSFPEIKLQNFLSHASSVVRLAEPGLTVVVGENRDSAVASSNGAGKSTPFNALFWCLYGETLSRDHKGLRGEDVIRRGSDGACRVDLTVADSAGKAWIISREQKGSKGMLHVFNRSDTGSPLALGGERATQAWVEALLGMDAELFAQCIILGQDSPVFAASTDAHRKEALERVAGVGDYGDYRDVASKRLTKLSRDIETVESERKQHLAAAATALGIVDPTSMSQDSLSAQADAAVREAERTLSREPELKAALTLLEQERQELQRRDSGLRSALSDVAIRHTMAAESAKQWERGLADLKTKCPTCKRPFDPESLGQSRMSLEQSLAVAVAARDAAAARVREARSRFDTEDAVVAGQMQRVQAAIMKATAELGGLEAQRGKERMLRGAADRLAKADLCAVTLRTLAEERPYLEFWVDAWGPKGVKSYVFDSVAVFLNSAIRRYADTILGGDIEVQFHTQRPLKGGGVSEDFHVTALNRVGSDLYASKSAGERQRVDLCVALALQTLARQRAKTSVQLLVLDEICTNIDAVGEELVYKMLMQLAQDVPVYLISHKAGLQDVGANLISVVKSKGVSTVVQRQ